jgi:hypothetical protein
MGGYRFGSLSAANRGMRGFLILVVVVGLGAFFYWQKQREVQSPITPKPAISQSAATQPTQPTQPPQVSEHNWMKRSLDRASAVAEKARAQTKESQDP